MVFFNYATMQMAAKIVYYGPGLCGKTTNLHHIYTKTAPQSRGEMVSLETETDRTLFFDLLPIDVGVIGGFKTRLQLYTVPGQVFYNTTRKLVLKGVDGLVFVADSQKAMLEANVESLKNLRDNVTEIGLNLDELPLVIQLNKRDLPNIADVETMLNALDPERRFESVEAVAYTGAGVFETLKLISKLTLRTLRRRMTGEEPVVKPATRPAVQFKVKDEPTTTAPARAFTATTPATPTPAIATTSPSAPTFTAPATAAATTVAEPTVEAELAQQMNEDLRVAEPAPQSEPEPFAALSSADVDARILFDAPIPDAPEEDETTIDLDETPSTQYIPPPTIAKALPTEPEIEFPRTEKPAEKAPAPPEVKTVKVRSSVDVMAELEALRKRATHTTATAAPKPKKDAAVAAALDSLSTARAPRDIHKTMSLQIPAELLARSKSVRVTVSFSDGDQAVLQTEEQTLELGDTTDVQSLSVNLKIDPA